MEGINIDQGIQDALSIVAPAPDQTPAPPPEKFGEVPADQFFQALESATGVKSLDDIKAAMEARSRLPELQTKLTEYEAKQAISPFANPLSEKINEAFRSGADLNTVERMIYLNKIDLQSVGDMEAIKIAKGLEKPGFTSEELDVLIERELGFDPADYDADNARHRVALRELSERAKSVIQDQRVNFDNPEEKAKMEAISQQNARVVDAWGKTVLPSIAQATKVPISVKDEANGIDYAFEFQPPADAMQQAMQATMQTIQSNPAAFPLNQATAGEVQQLVKGFLMMFHGDKIMESIARDAYAKATLELKTKMAGAPPQRPSVHIPTAPNSARASGSIPADATF